MEVENKNKPKKVDKKVRRCLAIIQKDHDLSISATPTVFLIVLNAGLSNGLTKEALLATASAHGEVTHVLMKPAKSFCFLKCATIADAKQIYEGMHNVAAIGQKGTVVYLSYLEHLHMDSKSDWETPWPDGLKLLKDFVSAIEESAILDAIAGDEKCKEGSLKHRHVKHFGYEFLYGSNSVNPTEPLAQRIPTVCDSLWPRVKALTHDFMDLDWTDPDQLTVNEYESGQGIPQHVDTHSAFLDPILSLSLQSDIVMDFRRGNKRVHVLLPRRSLLIMSGESRYEWTHGITPKHSDVVPTKCGSLTTQVRSKRTSLTFRRLRRGACNCSFPTLCDTKQSVVPQALSETLANQALILEQQNVHEVYEQIADHFSDTRHSPWPQVSDFLNSFDAQSVVLDVGCGNGKYLGCNNQLLAIGCDRSQGLLSVCCARGQNVFRCDCMQLPIRTASIDGCISIAVIHHLASAERRLTALREMARVLRPGGRALVYVWAKDQKSDNHKSSYLRQNKAVNKQRTTEQVQRQVHAEQLHVDEGKHQTAVVLPVHTNRTEFQQQDVFVPWKTKDAQKTIFLRYYHVFEAQELENLVSQMPGVMLKRSYYDQGNHCVIFERKSS